MQLAAINWYWCMLKRCEFLRRGAVPVGPAIGWGRVGNLRGRHPIDFRAVHANHALALNALFACLAWVGDNDRCV